MSEKRLIDFETFCKNCSTHAACATRYKHGMFPLTYEESSKKCSEWQELKAPILPDVTGNRALDSMTEEEAKEFYRRFGLYVKSDITKWSETIKWFLEKGFNVFEVGE